MTRFIYSIATWASLVIDRQAWEVVEWNLHEIGLRETVATLIDDQACILDGVMQGRGNWADLYDL